MAAQRSNEQIKIQMNRMEILHQIIKDINIDMSLADIVGRVYNKLPKAIPCCFLGLALAENDKLIMTAATPVSDCVGQPVPSLSVIWQSYSQCKRNLYDSSQSNRNNCGTLMAGWTRSHRLVSQLNWE